MRKYLLPILIGFAFAHAALAAEAKTFLKENDHLVFIGDSLTAMGQYVTLLDGVVQQAYPDAGIKVVNYGSGGKRADAAVPLLKEYLNKNNPTLVFMMFGVNDTQWRNEDVDKKSAAFTDNLRKMHDFCISKNLPLILIKESPFSHNLANDLWLSGVNAALDSLFNAQQEYAVEHNIPVIDGYGLYKRNLSAAWAKNPRYEFTPDVVHPISPGSAALCSSLIKALGVGLELSGDKRAELITAENDDLQIEILNDLSVVESGNKINCKVRIRNLSRSAKKGSVSLLTMFGKPINVACSLSALSSKTVEIPVVLPEVNMVSPLFVRFSTDTDTWCSDTIIYVAPQQSIAGRSVTFSEKDFSLSIHQEGYRKAKDFQSTPVPMKSLKVSADKQTIHLVFNWNDTTPVLAKDTTQNRVGQPVNAPVDVLARPGAQRCDSIDFLLDMRSLKETGRPTADVDGVPKGVVKIVVFRKQTAEGSELEFRCYPENLKEKIKLSETGKMSELSFASPTPFTEFSLMAFINDCFSEEKNNTACFYLKDGLPGDPMRTERFTTESKNNVFYRIGY